MPTAAGLEPLFFGPPGARIFGSFEGPREAAAGCIVLCASVGHEHERFHRALRRLAAGLAARRWAVLRFDLRGSGDSSGDLTSVRFADWLADLDRAVEMAEAMASRPVSCILGHRIGAGVALASERLAGTERAVLWDPVLSGRAYVEHERRRHRSMLARTHLLAGPAPAAGHEEILGETWSVELLAELEDRLPPPRGETYLPRGEILHVDTAPGSRGALPPPLDGGGAAVEKVLSPVPELWEWTEDISRIHVPHRVVETILSWVTAGSPEERA